MQHRKKYPYHKEHSKQRLNCPYKDLDRLLGLQEVEVARIPRLHMEVDGRIKSIKKIPMTPPGIEPATFRLVSAMLQPTAPLRTPEEPGC
jgi:hypothetical protein